jgi:hypothetical protein
LSELKIAAENLKTRIMGEYHVELQSVATAETGRRTMRQTWIPIENASKVLPGQLLALKEYER